MVIREEKIGNLKEILNKWYTTTDDYERDKAELDRQIAAAQAESQAVNDALEAIYAKINSLIGFTVKIVDELPQPGEFGTVFFKKARNGKDYYEAWVWVDDDYQQVGAIDLSDYALKTQVNSLANELRRTVTDSYAGLMSTAQKQKLDGIENNANNYSLPTASGNTKGGVKVGSNLTMDGDTMNAKDTTYSTASGSRDGLMSKSDKSKLDGIQGGANNYSLPAASSNTRGGIKVGSGLSISGDVLSVSGGGGSSGGGSSYVLPTASPTQKGGIKVGNNLYMDGETLHAQASSGSGGSSYTLPTASNSQKGGIKVGKWLSMSSETLNVSPRNSFTDGKDDGKNVSISTFGNVQIFSWWSNKINNVVAASQWTTWQILPKKNTGKTVWSNDILNSADGNLYLRVPTNSDQVQYYSSKTGDIPITPGQLVMITDPNENESSVSW